MSGWAWFGAEPVSTSTRCSQIINIPVDMMSYSGYTLLDVATATIKGNQELVLALDEAHLANVVQLLVVMTTNFKGSSESSSMDGRQEVGFGLTHRNSATSFNMEWSPAAGQKCLEFLHAAVWVDSKSNRCMNVVNLVFLSIRHVTYRIAGKFGGN